MKLKNTSTLGWITAAVVTVALIVQMRHGQEEAKHAIQSENTAPVSVTTTVVRQSEVGRYLDATGTVQPEFEATIATRIQGRVLEVLAREGDRVRKGQPLVRLDSRDLNAAVQQADANVNAATVGWQNSRVAADMEEKTSQARVGQAESQVAVAEAALQSAQARMRLVETGPRKQERAQAGLAVTQAKAALDLADSNHKRMQTLYDKGAIARQQLDTYRMQADVARAQYETALQSQSIAEEGSRQEEIESAREGVRQAKAALAQAVAGLQQAKAGVLQARMRKAEIRSAGAQVGQAQAASRIARVSRDYATLVAPFDGVITRRLADPGVMALPGSPLMIIHGGRKRLESIVPESALGTIRKGMSVPVSLDALKGTVLDGVVSEIAPQGDTASRTFKVKIDLPENAAVRSGMYGMARFRTGTSQAITVPETAVWQREGLNYVYVVGDDNRARLRLITVGPSSNGYVSALSGLAVGEKVIISDTELVTDGAAVTAREG
ncbi:MAG TPA: efflux RND transporter periplasmic adaptor subunit [Armatimonadota bacterium]|nr:efflux RND transporter periplasmic adaptor subunit [Armatimonadota bacterium]